MQIRKVLTQKRATVLVALCFTFAVLAAKPEAATTIYSETFNGFTTEETLPQIGAANALVPFTPAGGNSFDAGNYNIFGEVDAGAVAKISNNVAFAGSPDPATFEYQRTGIRSAGSGDMWLSHVIPGIDPDIITSLIISFDYRINNFDAAGDSRVIVALFDNDRTVDWTGYRVRPQSRSGNREEMQVQFQVLSNTPAGENAFVAENATENSHQVGDTYSVTAEIAKTSATETTLDITVTNDNGSGTGTGYTESTLGHLFGVALPAGTILDTVVLGIQSRAWISIDNLVFQTTGGSGVSDWRDAGLPRDPAKSILASLNFGRRFMPKEFASIR